MASLLVDTHASAASLTAVSGWQQGTEPSWVSAYEYVPANFKAGNPILVLVHYCSGNAQGIFQEAQNGGMVTLADQKGILLVVPQTSQNCWDVATTPSLTHNGGGDTGAIVHQVQHAITAHQANADRVYAVGASSGAMVVEALMAVYPDVFKGGSEFSGVPAGCWSVNDPDGQWSSPCANGTVTHTAQEWGDMARGMYPGYTGFRPRIQLWHGTGDTTINPANQTEAIKQWTNVFGLTTTPTTTSSVTIGGHMYNRSQWNDSCGNVVIDAFTEPNGPHGTDSNMDGTYSMPFLDLDQNVGAVDAQVAKCQAAAGGAGGMGGMSASGGMGASGDMPAAGGTGAGGMSASGGMPATGGTGRGGMTSTGGTTGGAGGTTGGAGGIAGGTGMTAGGTAGGTGLTAGRTGMTAGGTGVTTSAGGTGTGGMGTGGTGASGKSAAGTSTGGTSTSGTDTTPPTSAAGCGCEVPGRSGRGSVFAWTGLLAMGAWFARRRRANGRRC